jgi:hypothetical protein
MHKCTLLVGYSRATMTRVWSEELKSSRADVRKAGGYCGQSNTSCEGLFLSTISHGNASNEGSKAWTGEHCSCFA